MTDKLVVRDADIEGAISSLQRIRSTFEQDDASADVIAAAVGHRRLADEVRGFADSWRINRERLTDSLDALAKGLREIDTAFTTIDDESAKAIAAQKFPVSAFIPEALTRTSPGDTGVRRHGQATGNSTSSVSGGSKVDSLDDPADATPGRTSTVTGTRPDTTLDDPIEAAPLPVSAAGGQRVEAVLTRIEELLGEIRDDVDVLANPLAVGAGVAGLGSLAALLAGRTGAGGGGGHQRPGRPVPGSLESPDAPRPLRGHPGQGLDGSTELGAAQFSTPAAAGAGAAGLGAATAGSGGFAATGGGVGAGGGSGAPSMPPPGGLNLADLGLPVSGGLAAGDVAAGDLAAGGLAAGELGTSGLSGAPSPGMPADSSAAGGSSQTCAAEGGSAAQNTEPRPRRFGGMPMAMGGMGGGGSSASSDRERAAQARQILAQWRADQAGGNVQAD